MIDQLASVGAWVRGFLADIGHATALFFRLLWQGPACVRRFGLVRDQMHFLGNHSLAIIAVSGLFVGFVLALQGYNTLQRFGSASALGLLVALSLVRELGPVVSALLFAGRAGTSLTAEIGLMKAGEQLSAMEMMAIDPVARILAPRFWAGVLVMPLLGAIFSAVGVLGGWLVGVVMIGVDGTLAASSAGNAYWATRAAVSRALARSSTSRCATPITTSSSCATCRRRPASSMSTATLRCRQAHSKPRYAASAVRSPRWMQ